MKGRRLDTWCALMAGRLALEEFGWCRGTRPGPNSPVCAVDSVYRAGGATSNSPWYFALQEACGLRDFDMVSDWNDRKSRTKRQVLAAFDRALAAVERGE